MWDLGNRGVVALASTFTGCVFLYNIWGPILILTISLLLTIYACYSLIINDSLLSPHACLFFDYCRNVSVDVRASLEAIVNKSYQYTRQLLEAAYRPFQKQYLTPFKMDRRRGSHYQLSSDSYPTRKETSNPKGRFHQRSSHASMYNHSSFGKHTSTPIYTRNKDEFENETFELSSSSRTLSKGASPVGQQNHSLTGQQDAAYFATEGSPWNIRASPKAERSVGHIKSADSLSGPLSSSTRYNIDAKVYNDVTSPGLTARLTKYAAEASNKLTCQSHYRVGQFPRVNLHASPVPLINAKSVRTRTPVTVRVAPPEAIRYTPPSKQKILTDTSCASPSVAQALREISLKRHASIEDVASDLAKKQRTDGLAGKKAEVHDETKQKRSRDESTKSEEDSSPQSKAVRPTKRTKTPSCYDIINSLSSSKHVASGVKRKASDFSRSGTPDVEKHFKSVESAQVPGTKALPQIPCARPRIHRSHDMINSREKEGNSNGCNYVESFEERSPLKGILKVKERTIVPESKEKQFNGREANSRSSGKDRSASTESMRLTDKLFMRAEPERNEKLRMLVEEQGNIRAKFTTDDVDEIKKEDIADMRQTSMKARLQSMFDAISGKATSQINPDVVIQAEEISSVVESISCPVTCATLNSSTITTNVNTTPISTSAVAPSPGTSEPNVKSPKHVAFNLPCKEAGSNTKVPQPIDTFRTKTESDSSPATNTMTGVSANTSAFTVKSGMVPQTTGSSSASTTISPNTNAQNFHFGKSPLTTSIANGSSTRDTFAFTFDAASASGKPSSVPAVSTSVSIFGNVATATSMASTMPSTMSTGVKGTAANGSSDGNEGNAKPDASQAASIVSSRSKFASGSFPSSDLGGTRANAAVSAAPTRREDALFSAIATSGNAAGATSAANSGAGSAPMFTFGSKVSDTATNPKSGTVFAFGSSTTKSASGTGVQVSNPVATIATTVVGFGSIGSIGKTTSPPSFASSTSSTFAFRGANPASASDGNVTFSFGSNAPTAAKASTGSSVSAVSPFTAEKSINATTGFGAPASTGNTPGQFANSTAAPSIFGSTTTGNQAIFGASSGISGGTATVTFAPPKSTAPTVFGPHATANAIPLFSNTGSGSTSGTASTVSKAVFGSNANILAPGASGATARSNTATSSNLFSGASLTAASPATFATTGKIFGQGNTPAVKANYRNDLGVFGNNSSSSTLFASQANPSSTFGAGKVPASSTSPAFRPPSRSVTNGSAATFGVANTATSAFGSQAKTESGGQSTGPQPFGIGASIFGTENTGASAFGQQGGPSGAAAAPFPASAPASGGTFAGQHANPAFGAANAPAGVFGDGNKESPFGSQASVFGTSNVSTGATFGNGSASNENNNTGVFTFGSSQKPPAQQQTSAFSFGSNTTTSSSSSSNANANNNNNNSTNNSNSTNNNNQNSATTNGSNNATVNSAPFQFRAASTAPPAAGFNFSALPATPSINFGTTTAPPTFNASTPGMFSIGSGSTAPRSRYTRARKPR